MCVPSVSTNSQSKFVCMRLSSPCFGCSVDRADPRASCAFGRCGGAFEMLRGSALSSSLVAARCSGQHRLALVRGAHTASQRGRQAATVAGCNRPLGPGLLVGATSTGSIGGRQVSHFLHKNLDRWPCLPAGLGLRARMCMCLLRSSQCVLCATPGLPCPVERRG